MRRTCLAIAAAMAVACVAAGGSAQERSQPVRGVVLDSIDVTNYPRIVGSMRVLVDGVGLPGLLETDIAVRFGTEPVSLRTFSPAQPAQYRPTIVVVPLRGMPRSERDRWVRDLALLRERWGSNAILAISIGDTVGRGEYDKFYQGDWGLRAVANGSGRPADADSSWRPLTTAEGLQLVAEWATQGATVAVLLGRRDDCQLTCLRRINAQLSTKGSALVVVARDTAMVASAAWRAIEASNIRTVSVARTGLFDLAVALATSGNERYFVELETTAPQDGVLRELEISLTGPAAEFAAPALAAIAPVTSSAATIGGVRSNSTMTPETATLLIGLMVVLVALLAGIAVVIRRRAH
jgi:hypothetical protein